MRRVGFDYGNTCPKIDKQINAAKAAIESFIDGLIDEACPLIEMAQRKRLAADYAERLYYEIEPAFEAVRETNEDMRREAERQITDLAEQVAILEYDLAALQ